MSSAIPRYAARPAAPTSSPEQEPSGPERGERLRLINGTAPPSHPIRAFKGIVLTLCCLIVIVPFVAVVSTSLADQKQVNAAGGYVLWPADPTFHSYEVIFSGGVVTRALFISVGITLVGSLLSVICVSLLAYSLSRPGTFAHKPILLIVLFTLLFSPGIIPSYLLIKELGLLDSYWSLILPGLTSGFQIIVLRAFFMAVPSELTDSARIDGASEFQIFTRIMLPLSKAAIAVIALFNMVTYWNAFFNALLYINDNSKWPLQLILRTYVVEDTTIAQAVAGEVLPPQQSLQMAILVISLIPIVMVYPFLQKHFAKGILIGAVKG